MGIRKIGIRGCLVSEIDAFQCTGYAPVVYRAIVGIGAHHIDTVLIYEGTELKVLVAALESVEVDNAFTAGLGNAAADVVHLPANHIVAIRSELGQILLVSQESAGTFEVCMDISSPGFSC